eukprot:244662_1
MSTKSTLLTSPSPRKPSLSEPLLTNTKLLAVFFVQLNEAYQISVLLPIVVFMCRDFGISSKWLGVYTSVLNASFGFCQFLVSYLWGYLSDIYGRRTILLFGLIGTFLSMIAFGFSTSFTMAMVCRCSTGFFNGNLGVVKAYLADITDSSNRGWAFSVIGVSFGAGIILGSMMGGMLIVTHDVDAPDDDYIPTTSILKWFIFEHDFPFLLPTAVCGGVITFNALLWTLLFIKDVTIKRKTRRSTNYTDDTMQEITSDIEMTSSNLTSTSAPRARLHSSLDQAIHEHENLAMNQSLPSHHEINAMLSNFEAGHVKLLSEVRESKSIDEYDDDGAIDVYALTRASDLLKYTKLGHALVQYGIVAISHMMFKEMAPVFMAQALYFSSVNIGYTFAFSGIVLIIFCIFIQPICLQKFKHTKMQPFCALITSISALLMPSIYWFTFVKEPKLQFMTEQWWLVVMACGVEWIMTMAVSLVFVVAACWVNNSVPNCHVGKANGIGQTLASFVRGFGPLLTGFIWSESFTQMELNGKHYAVYYAYLPTAILFLVMVVDVILYIPSDLQRTWEDRERDQASKKKKRLVSQ